MNPVCKCCSNPTVQYLGDLDFNKTCHDRFGKRVFPISDEKVPYYACQRCGFIYTNYMNGWSDDLFRERIYNSEYGLADGVKPGYENKGVRESISYENGLNLVQLLNGSQGEIRVLDYGSGGKPGATGLALLDKGFDLYSYEPYLADDATLLPTGKFDVIIAIEVVEHCNDLNALTEFVSKRLSRDGVFYVQTVLHPFPTPNDVLNSWYIAPRNGHISIFTFRALAILFARVGINIVQTLNGVVGFKSIPRFKNHFFV